MRIPDVQKRLEEIQKRIEEISYEEGLYDLLDLARELLDLTSQLSRRSVGGKAPNSSAPCGPEKREAIRRYKAHHPTMTQLEIGRVFNVNQGRVSEALRGFRT